METLAKKGEAVSLTTAGKRFAVIVDEAHSSQSGETAMELRKILNKDGIEAAIAAQVLDDEEDESLSQEAKENLLREMLKRPKQDNISFFAFTATPKFKTLAFFNEPGDNGTAPFHHYSMRQAIEEEFILDVLENYTTYNRYLGLIKTIKQDPQVPKKQAAKALARFMDLHPVNIGQKVEIIVEHFCTYSRHKIGGRAKAMIVTGSRLHAVRYKLAFDKYLKDKGYTDIRSLVAFSGKVVDSELPGQEFTEAGMNKGIKETELPEIFGGNEYQVLLVADKYQTGFDQPLLHSMYVDKRLAGIQAVQTLSRLNRVTTGKEDTFVMDFVNDRDEIYKAFKQFYEKTEMGDASDPQQLYDLQHRLLKWQVFDIQAINDFCQVWFTNRHEPLPSDHQKLNELLDKAVIRYETLDDIEQELFKGQLTSFKSLYTFLAQIIPYQDSDLEKMFTYNRFLLAKLPYGKVDKFYRVQDDVALKYYRLQKISEGSIDLKGGNADPLRGPTEVGTAQKHEDEITLSSLIEKLNERFGTDFTLADQLFFEQIEEIAKTNEQLQEAAMANSLNNFERVFNKMLEGLFIERMEGNEDIFRRLMEDGHFRTMAASHLAEKVYHGIRENVV
jgi:type I restriction enzyme R subunit